MPIVKVNDINMYYEMGRKGELIALVGGLGTSMTAYRNIADRLSQGFSVLFFDSRGAGRTDKPDVPYTIEMMAEDTAGLFGALDVKSANVVGISMGGRIAIELTLRHPELVKSLVLASTCAKQPLKTGSAFQFKLVKLLMQGTTLLGRSPQPYYAFVRQLGASRAYDCSDRLAEISVPTLIAHGRKDKTVPYELAEQLHSGIKGSKIVTFKGGHRFVFWEYPGFVDAITKFLGAVD
jgi:3-oxoadipate enol-lactonase